MRTRSKILARTLGATAATFLLAVFVTQAKADAPAPRPAAQFEVKYLSGTIDHHFMAVQMSELCPGRVVLPPLLDLCSQIVSDQGGEIEQMKGWLRSWYGFEKEPVMRPSDETQLRKLAALSGPAFDVTYMRMMSRHHERGVREAARCLRQSFHPELRNFCAHVIEEQNREIAMMKSWLCIWYNVCP